MALPTIPSSFVPYTASSTHRFRSDFTGAFAFFAYAVLVVMFLLAMGVFFYGRVLASSQASKDAELAAKIAKIDQTTIATFVRLHDHLVSGKTLLSGHVALSGFFDSFGGLLPASVRFSSLHITVPDEGAEASMMPKRMLNY